LKNAFARYRSLLEPKKAWHGNSREQQDGNEQLQHRYPRRSENVGAQVVFEVEHAGEFALVSARIYGPLPRNAGRTGTLPRLNSEQRGHKAEKELFYPYGKTYAQTLGEQD
jgi:hypothetical protein